MTSLDTNQITGSFVDQLDKKVLKDIENLYNKIDKDVEFELMFFNYRQDKNKMGLENFLKILDYLKYRSQKNKLTLSQTVTLDITYTKQIGESYRITINGIDAINRYIKMLHTKKNHVIFSVLIKLLDQDSSLSLMKKTKDKENIIDINDFDIRVRLSKETDVSKKEIDELTKIKPDEGQNIMFRYKQRASLEVESSKNSKISIDLTNIKMTSHMNYLEKALSVYELEIDCSSESKDIPKKYLDIIFSETNILLKILQQSNFIISKTLEQAVLDHYAALLNLNKSEMVSLDGRKPVSLEVQHISEPLPNKYAVTDKADGERFFLIIYKNAVFLISDLLNVRNTGILLPESKKQYNDSIIDGELIFVQSANRYIFMGFDCLYSGGKDIRGTIPILERIQSIDEIVEKCFINKNHEGYKHILYTKKYDIDDILKFHETEIIKFMKALNHDINIDKQHLLIRRKYFIPVLGGQNNEIYKYSTLLWNKYTKDDKVDCPYILDGLIYHPLEQKYVASAKDTKYFEYKWKPEDKNSIDFYVTYERNKNSGNIVTLYDNSQEEVLGIEELEKVRGKPYKILILNVGRTIKNVEQPVLFEPEKDSVKYMAYIYLVDGEVRDQNGNIIQDKTVVEFYYKTDPNIPEKFRWMPIRTRFDKTESVQRFGRKYGNYTDIANKVWRSIRNPITINDFSILANDDTYSNHNAMLKSKVDHSIIMSEAKENAYYQKRTNLGKPMRNWHNWIKSNLIYTYTNFNYVQSGKHMSVLDYGCGRGGDLMKYYYSQVDFYVGIDVDNNGLASPGDGAISRYNQFRKTKANFPKCSFIHADGGTLLNYEDQNKALGGMDKKNMDLMNQYFSKESSKRTQFDSISCEFAVHYLFANETVFSNFTQNINDYLKPGGIFILTTFDADRIIDALKDKDKYTINYTAQNGEQQVLIDIIKNYKEPEKNTKIGLGYAISIHNDLYSNEGEYITEYLVQKDFMVEELAKRCNLELLDTDLFENQYHIHSDFFLNEVYKQESSEKTRQFLKDVSEFFTQKTDINNASYQMSRLYRYYAFRKKSDIKPVKKEINQTNQTKQTKQKPKQKGGLPVYKVTIDDVVFNDAADLIEPTKFIKRNIDGIADFSFMMSVHDVLKNHKIIPEHTSMMEFCDDIGYQACSDKGIDKNTIVELNKNLIIKHEYTEGDVSSEMALHGVNIILLKKDCDDSTIVEKHGCGARGNISRVAPFMVLYNDGKRYYPIYKHKEDSFIGLYDSKMDFINTLLKKK